MKFQTMDDVSDMLAKLVEMGLYVNNGFNGRYKEWFFMIVNPEDHQEVVHGFSRTSQEEAFEKAYNNLKGLGKYPNLP